MDLARSDGSLAVRLFTWLVACCFATAALAWLGFVLQQSSVAPLGIYSLVLGAAIGSATAGIWGGLGLSGRLPIAAVLLWATIALVVQEQLAYRKYLVLREEAILRNPQMATVLERTETGPPTFAGFIRTRFERAKMWWTVDALLTTIASLIAAAVVLSRGRSPNVENPA